MIVIVIVKHLGEGFRVFIGKEMCVTWGTDWIS